MKSHCVFMEFLLRHPAKMSLQGPLPWWHPSSSRQQTVVLFDSYIVHTRVTLRQWWFKVCLICKCLCNKWKTNPMPGIIFCYQWKHFQWMIVLVGMYVSYIAVCQFWNHVQANTSNGTADPAIWIWERGTSLTVGKMRDDIWSKDYLFSVSLISCRR